MAMRIVRVYRALKPFDAKGKNKKLELKTSGRFVGVVPGITLRSTLQHRTYLLQRNRLGRIMSD
jgi:hypothetical protein